ncbi:MAG: ribosome maturation factor RimM [Rhodothermales bacterium]
MNPVEPDSLILVGTCGPPHGVRGELKVIPETDDPGRLADLESLFLGPSPERARARTVEGIRFQTTKRGTVALVTFAGVPDREAADALRGLSVFAVESDLPALAEGEVFLHDLIGLGVVTEDGEDVGTVQDVLTGGAQRLLLVKRPGRPDALVPDVDAIVTDINLDAGQITIAPPEGLLD